MATQYRVAAERDREQVELEEMVAKLEARLKAAAANTGALGEKDMALKQWHVFVERVFMETTPEMDRFEFQISCGDEAAATN